MEIQNLWLEGLSCSIGLNFSARLFVLRLKQLRKCQQFDDCIRTSFDSFSLAFLPLFKSFKSSMQQEPSICANSDRVYWSREFSFVTPTNFLSTTSWSSFSLSISVHSGFKVEKEELVSGVNVLVAFASCWTVLVSIFSATKVLENSTPTSLIASSAFAELTRKIGSRLSCKNKCKTIWRIPFCCWMLTLNSD